MERIALEHNMLETEKMNFKKNVTRSSKVKTIDAGAESNSVLTDSGGREKTRKQCLELKGEIQKLRVQLESYEKKEESRERRKSQETLRLSSGIAVVDLREEQKLKLLELEKELREIKRDHMSLTKRHAIERAHWEDSILKTVKNASTRSPAANSDALACSPSEDVNRLCLLVRNYEEENNKLRKENEHLRRSSQPLSKATPMNRTEYKLGGTDNDRKVSDDLNVLRVEWRREKEILETRLRDQSRQIDDWKLLLPRNNILLERAISENKQLTKELEDEKNRERKLCESKTESKRIMKSQQLEQQLHEDGEISLQEVNTEAFGHNSSNTRDSSAMIALPSTILNNVLIPLDLSSEDKQKLKKKFVVEWEWSNGGNGLGGLYTGWLDLGGNPCGNGTLRIDDGGVYIGEWKKGLRNGNGVYTSIDGAIYYGPWLNDKFHGRGVFVSETNQVYTGDWMNGVRHGSGIETWEDGAIYTGYYNLDKRNGAFPQ
jgi:hypothetical protein